MITASLIESNIAISKASLTSSLAACWAAVAVSLTNPLVIHPTVADTTCLPCLTSFNKRFLLSSDFFSIAAVISLTLACAPDAYADFAAVHAASTHSFNFSTISLIIEAILPPNLMITSCDAVNACLPFSFAISTAASNLYQTQL